MSRSYRKEPVIKYAPRGNWGQKQANRKVRRYCGDLSFGMGYKKLYEQWNIHDCKSRSTLSEYLKDRENWIQWCDDRGFSLRHSYYGVSEKEAIYKWKRNYILK